MGLRLAYKIDDTVEIDGKKYQVNASFDNIIRLTELLNGPSDNELKVEVAMQLLFGESLPFTLEEKQRVVEVVTERYVESARQVIYDLKGEDITELVNKNEQPVMDLNHDAEYIYSAFIQAYGIDLIDQQGKLHWFKFRALLKSLPQDTRFIEIVGYRAYKMPSKSETHHSQMMKLKEAYKLPSVNYDETEGVESYG